MLSPDLQKALASEAAAVTSPRDRARLLTDWANRTGISISTLRRIIAKSGVKPTRISGGGRPREYAITDLQMELIVAHIYTTIRQNGKKITGVVEAIRMAELRGQIPEQSVSVGQIRSWMRANDLLVRDITAPPPTGQLYSKYPNHVQLFDASVCLQWEFPSVNERMKFLNWKIDLGRNKIVEEVTRRIGQKRSIIWRIALTDHYSNLIYVRYYQLSGESAVATAQFLQDAWFPKSNPAMVFCGLPKVLIADRGPGNKSQILDNLCRNYGIDLRLHETGHAWAKGSVEVSHNIIETHFECFLNGNPPTSIQELNARAEDWQTRWNANQILRRNGMKIDTRNALWSQIQAEQLRVPSSIQEFQLAASRSIEEVTVNVQGLIRFKVGAQAAVQPTDVGYAKSEVRIFRCPDALARSFGREKLKVIFNPFLYRDSQSIYVSKDGDSWMTAAEVEMNAAGFLKTARPIHHPTKRPTNLQEEFRQRADERVLPPAAVEEMPDFERHQIAAMAAIPVPQISRAANVITVRYTALQALDQIFAALPGLARIDRSAVYAEITAPHSREGGNLSGDSYTSDEIDALIAFYKSRFARQSQSAAG